MSQFQPPSTLDDTGPHQPTNPIPPAEPPREAGCIGNLIVLAVMTAGGCMCAAIILLSGFAGVRDEVQAVSTEDSQTLVADVATQYTRGIEDFNAERYELAEVRFSAVEEALPGYQDNADWLARTEQQLTAIPTPTEIPPIVEATPIPTVETVQSDETPVDPNEPTPENLYNNAVSAYSSGQYEEAIRWFEALILLEPNYLDARTQMIDALTTLGVRYLRGSNADGEDRLARGVQLVKRADDIGTVEAELLYEADFVERYLAARAYLDGGAIPDALSVLNQLCIENCDWAYRGTSVRTLLQEAGGTPPQP